MCGNGKSCDECTRGPCGPSNRITPEEWQKAVDYCNDNGMSPWDSKNWELAKTKVRIIQLNKLARGE